MASFTRSGVRIRYEIEGRGTPLLLHHGFSACLETWYHSGWVDALSDRYRLVLCDARGHGLSDKPREAEAYAPEECAKDALALLNVLDIQRTCFLGYSLGGRVGFELARLAPRRLRALALGGAHPYAQSMAGLRAALSGGLDRYRAAVEAHAGVALSRAQRELAARNDLDALRACVSNDRAALHLSLADVRLPILLYAGERDELLHDIVRAAQALPNARLLTVPRVGHFRLGIDSSPVLAAIDTFFADVVSERTESAPLGQG